MQRKVVTSARRLEAYGVAGLCMYYFELGLIDEGKINVPYIIKYIKYKEYMPIRTSGRKRESYKCENFNALSKSISGVKKKVLK